MCERGVGAAYRGLAELQGRLDEQEAEAKRLRERRELLEFQVEEISAAALETDEDERLAQEQSVLMYAERLIETAVQLETLLYQGEDSIEDRLGAASRLLDEAVGMDGSLKPRLEELNALRYGVDELARFFTDYARHVEHNPERLAEVAERLELLGHLKKKYGGSLEAALAYRRKVSEELARSEELDVSLDEIRAEIEAVKATFSELCGKLARAREKAARRLSSDIRKALGELGMSGVAFQVEFNRRETPEGVAALNGRRFEAGPKGIEQAEFYMSTNPGEAIRPLAKVASGGEISRIMLAMKTVLAHTNSVQVLIFDEIDIGISGRIAEVVGKKLKDLSQTYQAVSITHLPQIAKMADRHFSVRKEMEKGRTVTRVQALDGEDRAEELAKLMGGEEISKVTMAHAREMLSQN
jgi:DNA repair protein RecN (Recombination protein N)